MHPAEEQVVSFIKEHKLIPPGSKLLVGFSGGPDSLFLLHFLIKFERLLNIRISAAHVNHNLRGRESLRDEIFCSDFCKQNEIPVSVSSVDVKSYAQKNKLSVEQAARILRYQFFNSVCREQDLDLVVTAHTRNDNAETVLLNLIKGTGITGLGGIPVKRENIIRPLLCLEKSTIIEYLKKQNLKFRLDKSNLLDDYQRNFVRNRIIPEIIKINPNFSGNVLNMSFLLRNFNSELDVFIEQTIKEFTRQSVHSLMIKTSLFQKRGEYIAGMVIRRSIDGAFGKQLSYLHSKKIFSLLEKQTGSMLQLPGALSAIREREFIQIALITKNDFSAADILIGKKISLDNRTFYSRMVSKGKALISPEDNTVEFIDSEKIVGNSFVIRRWLPGDSFHPIGMKGRKKVSDFLTNAKVPADKKKHALVLLNNNKIVWLVGFRLDDRFKITNNTKKFIKISIR